MLKHTYIWFFSFIDFLSVQSQVDLSKAFLPFCSAPCLNILQEACNWLVEQGNVWFNWNVFKELHHSNEHNMGTLTEGIPVFRWQKFINSSIMQYKGSREVLFEIYKFMIDGITCRYPHILNTSEVSFEDTEFSVSHCNDIRTAWTPSCKCLFCDGLSSTKVKPQILCLLTVGIYYDERNNKTKYTVMQCMTCRPHLVLWIYHHHY